MMFISYKQIDRVYGSVDGFLNWLMNCSSGCSFRCDSSGVWYQYDYDSRIAFDNSGFVIGNFDVKKYF